MAMLLATFMSTAMAAQAAAGTIDPDALPAASAASSPASSAVPAASTPVVTRATIKFELLQALADDGIITAEQKTAAAAKYTAKDDTTRLVAYSEDESWTRYVTWSLTLKCLGLLLLFAAMWGWIKEFVRHFNGWLRKIPLVVYQSVFLSISLAGLAVPHLIYPAHAFDLALFCAFSTPLLLVWVVGTSKYLQAILGYFFLNGFVARYLLPTLGAAYFLGVALVYDSRILGMAAMWFLLSVPYLAISAMLRSTVGHSESRHLASAHASHLLGAALWLLVAPNMNNAVTNVLSVAATYYLPVAISLMLMLALAPLYTHRPAQNRVFYFALFIVLASASFSDYFAAMPAMNSMLALAGIATAFFWLVERSFKLGYLFGTFVTGAALYVLSLNIDTIRAWLSTIHFQA